MSGGALFQGDLYPYTAMAKLAKSRHRYRCECGAFCKPRWLPWPALGTDPNWECKNCGART